MLPKTYLLMCLLSVVKGQSDGNFWWLNPEVKKLNGGNVEDAKFEELNEFDNDESDKIVFGNDIEVSVASARQDRESKAIQLHFPSADRFVWPQDFEDEIVINNATANETSSNKDNNRINTTESDEFRFHFPDDGHIWKDINDSIPPAPTKPNSVLHDEVHIKPNSVGNTNSENICTYMEEKMCVQSEGLVYKERKRSNKMNTKYFNPSLVCCILHVKPEGRYRIVFPEPPYKNRLPRSTNNKEKNVALNQWKALLKKKISSKYQSFPSTRVPHITKKIVTEPDYEDPYDNVKNDNLKTHSSNSNKYPIVHTNYGSQEYGDDYTVELPRPGLPGIYSNDEGSWTVVDDDTVSVGDEYDDVGYGVSIADPRLDKRRKTKPKRKINRVSTSSHETDYEAGSETIRYQSYPDIQVLQGFKLLNLVRNRSRLHTKNYRKSTTQSTRDEDDYEVYDHFADDKGCGHDKKSAVDDKY